MAAGTISGVPRDAAVEKPGLVLVSRTGVPLSRSTTFRFTLDPNREQDQALLAHAGAARPAFNHHLGRVRANLGQRAAERSYGVAETDLTPALSWSRVSFIKQMNVWKDGRAPGARVGLDEDGNEVRGLAWRGEVSADVFECASVNAAAALANWSKSRKGERAGKAAGFPRFKSRRKTRTGVPAAVEPKPGAEVTGAGNPFPGPAVPDARRAPSPRAHRQASQDARVGPVSCVRGQLPVCARSLGCRHHRCRGGAAPPASYAQEPAPGPGGCGSRGQDPRGRR